MSADYTMHPKALLVSDDWQTVTVESPYMMNGVYVENPKATKYLYGKVIRPEKVHLAHGGYPIGGCEKQCSW